MNKRKKGNKSLYVIIIILGLTIIGLSISYAALSTTLSVKIAKVTQTAQTWNVGFEAKTDLAATASGTSDVGRSCGKATVTTTTATIADTTLSKPGDKCIWSLNIKNTGTISASLSTITPTKPTGTNVTCSTASGGSMVCGNITYKLTTDAAGKTVITNGLTIDGGGSKTIYLVAEYTGTELNTATVTQTAAAFSLVFSQK